MLQRPMVMSLVRAHGPSGAITPVARSALNEMIGAVAPTISHPGLYLRYDGPPQGVCIPTRVTHQMRHANDLFPSNDSEDGWCSSAPVSVDRSGY